MIFENDATAGVYVNSAFVEALNGFSNIATTSLELKNNMELLLQIGEELDRVEVELSSIQKRVLVMAVEKNKTQPLLAYVPPVETAEQRVELFQEERNPFLASLSGLFKGYGNWFAVAAAISMIFLLILLGRRKFS